jgi:hypothetical protein
MKYRLVASMFALSYGLHSWGTNYELPIISDTSPFYYVPQSKLEAQEKGIFSSKSYGGSGSYLESWSAFYGCRRCEFQNIILVNKKTNRKKALFESEKRISSFFVPTQKDAKGKLPPLLYLTLNTGSKPENTEFFVAHLDGSNLTRVSPEGHTVSSYDFDTQNKKLILLHRKSSTKEDTVSPARPFIVDLQKIGIASALLEN